MNNAVVSAAPARNTALVVVTNIGGDDEVGKACNEALRLMIEALL